MSARPVPVIRKNSTPSESAASAMMNVGVCDVSVFLNRAYCLDSVAGTWLNKRPCSSKVGIGSCTLYLHTCVNNVYYTHI